MGSFFGFDRDLDPGSQEIPMKCGGQAPTYGNGLHPDPVASLYLPYIRSVPMDSCQPLSPCVMKHGALYLPDGQIRWSDMVTRPSSAVLTDPARTDL